MWEYGLDLYDSGCGTVAVSFENGNKIWGFINSTEIFGLLKNDYNKFLWCAIDGTDGEIWVDFY
jgi:hypothetical protein